MQGLDSISYPKINSSFPPDRRRGLAIEISVAVILLSGAVYSFIQASNAKAGADFLAYLLLAVFLFLPTPYLTFQSYSLLRANYRLERDGLRLRWGWRTEDIPLAEVEWIRPAHDLVTVLPLPFPRWPGLIRGTRQVEGLGPIEFLASDYKNMLLIATPQRIFAISPANPKDFMYTFQAINEMGSLEPMPPKSTYSTFVLRHLWEDPVARGLLISSLVFGLGLLAVVSGVIPSHPSLSIGFTPGGDLDNTGPGERLLLLPVLNSLYLFVDFIVGIYFYRRDDKRNLAYLLWGASILSSLLFLAGVGFIIARS
jgi:hypothetical protein